MPVHVGAQSSLILMLYTKAPLMVRLGSHSSDYGVFMYVMLEYGSNMDAENKLFCILLLIHRALKQQH